MRTILARPLMTLSTLALMGLSACGGCGPEENNTNNEPDMTACTAGEVGCACTAESTCGAGAVCTDGMCVGATVSGLTVESADARSCEILLEETGAQIKAATYLEGVQGAMRRKAPRVAIAMMRDGDEAFPAGAASLTIDGETSGVRVDSVRCFDGAGAEIQGASVTLQ